MKKIRLPKLLLLKLLLSVSALVLSLLVGEGIARLIYTKPWYARLLEEQTSVNWRASVKCNSYGLRGHDYPETKPANSHRVLILGDSFTYGSGMTDGDAIFPALLEKQLNEEFSSRGEIVEILNGGIGGSLTRQWVDLLSRVQDSFQPDVVLVVFFLRDGTRTSSGAGFFGPIRSELERKHAGSLLYQHSYLMRLFQDELDRRYLSTKYAAAINEAYLGANEQTWEWEKAKRNILRIKAMAEAKAAKIGFVLFPVLVELNDRYPFAKSCEVITNFTKANNIPTMSLLPAYMGKNAPRLWVSSLDQHPNAVGHKIAADAMQPFLKQLISHIKPQAN